MIVAFKPLNSRVAQHVEKYINYFELLNNRTDVPTDGHKYERVALVLVDFSQNPPKVYEDDTELRADGFLSGTSTASINNLTFSSLIPSLLAQYSARFGTNP